jgi:hypothetical protein
MLVEDVTPLTFYKLFDYTLLFTMQDSHILSLNSSQAAINSQATKFESTVVRLIILFDSKTGEFKHSYLLIQ